MAQLRGVLYPKHSGNDVIAVHFDEMADLLELQGANPFRVRAYRNAASTVRKTNIDLGQLIACGKPLPKLQGIGDDLAGKIREIVTIGDSAIRQRLRATLPSGMVELLRIAGLGPKRVGRLYQDLGVENVQQLCQAAQQGRIRQLTGFGRKIEAQLLNSALRGLNKHRRFPLADVAPLAQGLIREIARIPGVGQATVAGSLRRMRDTVGDIDILVAAGPEVGVIARFIQLETVSTVLTKGHTRASVLLRSGLQVDLRVINPDVYGAALVYFTGSKLHNIALRKMAHKAGLKLSEYGLFGAHETFTCRGEADVYRALKLPWIAPELREDRGEIQAALAGQLPRLVERGDLKGDLHVHTLDSNGHNSIEEMGLAARKAGLEYLAITDHFHSLRMAHGLSRERLLQQIDQIDALNARMEGVTLLKGIEVDILEDGSLGLPDDVLRRLDVVIGAVHTHFNLSRSKQTARYLKAIEHPYFSILAHPLCRLINKREPVDLDLDAVIRAAAARGCSLELNAQPERMDLFDIHCQHAKSEGVLISVSSDARDVADFSNLYFGVAQARRGWLRGQDVLNTRPVCAIKSLQCGV